jgi:cytochrome c-type biogenesis protein CcmH
MKRLLRGLLMATMLAASLAAPAKEAVPLAEDEAVEQRLVAIASELRCLVCQNESLASSRADLAEDLRREIRSQIRQGKSDAEVMNYLVSRYGDFVRYRPPFKPTTWLLWGGPLLMFAIGLGMLAVHLRRRRSQADAPLSTAEREQAAQLLELP